ENRRYALLVLFGVFGSALLYGDGMITPAISVLSAMEGLTVSTSALQPFVIPLTMVVLAGLFAFQKFGAGKVGRIFGPVMLLWFLAIAVLGVRGIAQAPHVLSAFNPRHAWLFFAHNGWS